MPNKTPDHMEAFLIHGDDISPQWDFSHHVVPPMTASVIYRLKSTERGARGFQQFGDVEKGKQDPIYIYERLDEPTTSMLEDRLAKAERGDIAVCFSSGMSAISAVTGILTKHGDHILSNDAIYGCTYSLFTNWLPRQGIEVDFVSFNKTDLGSAIRPNTRIVYFETPINPTLELIDIEAVCNIVSEENQRRAPKDRMYVVVDNTFASPYCQRPIELGADFVIASLTKHISGFGTDMGGVVIGRKEFYTPLMLYRKDYGAILSGRHAWPFLVYGLPSLASRIRQTTATAMKLANFLSSHPKVERVNYPGLETFPQYRLAQKQMRCYKGEFMPSSILYFVLKGTPTEAQEKGRTLMDWLAKNALCYTLAVSLGHCKTLVEHPSSMTHSALSAVDQVRSGIDAGGVRVAVGLEEPEVLMKEMEAALQQI